MTAAWVNLELTRFGERCWGESEEEFPMPTHPPSRRNTGAETREFEPLTNAIRKWVKQASVARSCHCRAG
jgi:hypothetical protein